MVTVAGVNGCGSALNEGRDPNVSSLEMLDCSYSTLTTKKGAGEAGRAMKAWRALYNVMAAMPVNLAAVKGADESRKMGRKKLAEEQNEFRKLKLGG